MPFVSHSFSHTVIFIGEEEKKNLRSDVVQKLTLTKVAKNLATLGSVVFPESCQKTKKTFGTVLNSHEQNSSMIYS